ncbi:MAG: helix-turn-helix transcriptional regulator [Humibacillus sp.]|nr:helix-turn-helix transcriptional regulator [Humibacillus sp.]MDN5777419.1 helix-turn-helix transcriptional regulator [Humibacillus sp.]
MSAISRLEQPGSQAPLGEALLLVGDFWNVLVLQSVFLGARRFQNIRDQLSISDSVLSRRLSSLTEAGVIDTSPYQDRPVRLEYRLTDAGTALWDVLVAMWAWDRHWITGRHRLSEVDLQHLDCANLTRPVFGCGSCGAIGVTARDVSSTADDQLWASLVRRRGRRSVIATEAASSTGILGDQWSILVLAEALQGSRHFGEFQSRLGVSPVTLNNRLSAFVSRGVMTRSSVTDGARRQVYRLTPRGLDFFSITSMINRWAQHWLADDGRTGLTITHLACGEQIQPQLTCNACNGRLTREAIRFESEGTPLATSWTRDRLTSAPA